MSDETFNVQMPDGTIIQNVPRGTTQSQLQARLTPEQFQTTLASEIGPQLTAAAPPVQEGLESGFARGLTFGLDPILTAGSRAAGAKVGSVIAGDDLDFTDEFDRQLALERERSKAFTEQSPGLALASEITGAIIGPGKLIGGAKTIPGKIGISTAEGGVTGAGFAAGEGRDILEGGGIGAVIGAISPVAVGFLQKIPKGAAQLARSTNLLNTSPTSQQLANKARAAYQEAETSGVAFGQIDEFANQIRNKIIGQGARTKLTPLTLSVLDEIDLMKGADLSFQDIDGLRKVAQIAAGSQDRTEAKFGVQIVNAIDDFVEKGDVVTSGIAKEARTLWGRLRRDELVGEAIEKARQNSSGTEQGLRVEFRKILTNAKKRRGFSKTELSAMSKIVKGGASENTLRFIGKLGFNPNATVGNFVSGTLGTAGATAAGGLPGALALQATSLGARVGSEALQTRNAQLLGSMIRSGMPEGQIAGVFKALEEIGDNDAAFQALIRGLNITGIETVPQLLNEAQ